jgi:hypothetical protein
VFLTVLEISSSEFKTTICKVSLYGDFYVYFVVELRFERAVLVTFDKMKKCVMADPKNKHSKGRTAQNHDFGRC